MLKFVWIVQGGLQGLQICSDCVRRPPGTPNLFGLCGETLNLSRKPIASWIYHAFVKNTAKIDVKLCSTTARSLAVHLITIRVLLL
jgi:hypothetical protein